MQIFKIVENVLVYEQNFSSSVTKISSEIHAQPNIKRPTQTITQDCRADIQSSTVTHHCIWGCSPLLLRSLVDGRCVLSEPIGWLCL